MKPAQDADHKTNGSRREELLRLLHEAQEATPEENYITDAQEAEVAKRLGIPLAEAEGVTSFYRHFARAPRGRYVIRLCDSLTCRITGSLSLYHELRRLLGIRRGETTQDGLFTLEVVNCLGSCDRAPNLMINDELYTQIDEERLGEILDELRSREAKP